jgi:hypothetical protein
MHSPPLDKAECRYADRQVVAHSLQRNLTCAVSGWPRPTAFTWLFNSSRGLHKLNVTQAIILNLRCTGYQLKFYVAQEII